MIIFARAPGTTGWVEINPEEELSHRGQFWEIRKFAVESDDALPLARRLDRAEQALRMAGFQYHGPSEKWLASKAPAPLGWWTEELTKIYTASTGATISPDMVRAAGIALKVARGEIWDDLLEKWRNPQELLRTLVEDAQGILAQHLPPDGPSEETTLGRLYELLDGPRSREALPKLRDGTQKCPACQGNDSDMPCAYPGHFKAGCLRDDRLGGAI